jgi:hypothetical protein
MGDCWRRILRCHRANRPPHLLFEVLFMLLLISICLPHERLVLRLCFQISQTSSFYYSLFCLSTFIFFVYSHLSIWTSLHLRLLRRENSKLLPLFRAFGLRRLLVLKERLLILVKGVWCVWCHPLL